nr:MAG TPA: hypothetical protein [Caudoviricetes sp.]
MFRNLAGQKEKSGFSTTLCFSCLLKAVFVQLFRNRASQQVATNGHVGAFGSLLENLAHIRAEFVAGFFKLIKVVAKGFLGLPSVEPIGTAGVSCYAVFRPKDFIQILRNFVCIIGRVFSVHTSHFVKDVFAVLVNVVANVLFNSVQIVILHNVFSLLCPWAVALVPLLTFSLYHLRGILSTPLSVNCLLIPAFPDDDLAGAKIIINGTNTDADFILRVFASQSVSHGIRFALVRRAVVAGIVRTMLNRVKCLAHKKIPFHVLGG